MKNNTLIFGDSYSTFEGFVPNGYDIYYSENGLADTDVTQVSQTWWHQVMSEANLNLILNNSYSDSHKKETCYKQQISFYNLFFSHTLTHLQ